MTEHYFTIERNRKPKRGKFYQIPVGRNFLRKKKKAKMSALCVKAKFSGGAKENIMVKDEQCVR